RGKVETPSGLRWPRRRVLTQEKKFLDQGAIPPGQVRGIAATCPPPWSTGTSSAVPQIARDGASVTGDREICVGIGPTGAASPPFLKGSPAQCRSEPPPDSAAPPALVQRK